MLKHIPLSSLIAVDYSDGCRNSPMVEIKNRLDFVPHSTPKDIGDIGMPFQFDNWWYISKQVESVI